MSIEVLGRSSSRKCAVAMPPMPPPTMPTFIDGACVYSSAPSGRRDAGLDWTGTLELGAVFRKTRGRSSGRSSPRPLARSPFVAPARRREGRGAAALARLSLSALPLARRPARPGRAGSPRGGPGLSLSLPSALLPPRNSSRTHCCPMSASGDGGGGSDGSNDAPAKLPGEGRGPQHFSGPQGRETKQHNGHQRPIVVLGPSPPKEGVP